MAVNLQVPFRGFRGKSKGRTFSTAHNILIFCLLPLSLLGEGKGG